MKTSGRERMRLVNHLLTPATLDSRSNRVAELAGPVFITTLLLKSEGRKTPAVGNPARSCHRGAARFQIHVMKRFKLSLPYPFPDVVARTP
jgi:hypothetical protein